MFDNHINLKGVCVYILKSEFDYKMFEHCTVMVNAVRLTLDRAG